MDDKRIYDTIIKSEPLNKGWSDDKKYCVTTTDGTKYLLRISPISKYEARKSLFAILEQVAALGVPMCMPIEFGICDSGVYIIQSWIKGEDLETVLPALSDTEQYVLGLKAGEILRKIHTVCASDMKSDRPEWAESFDHTVDERIQKYLACGLRFENDEYILAYLEKNRYLIENRPRCFQHGDYCVRNIMLENGEIKIIDFERLYFGDPWEDFHFVMLDAPKTPHFTTGLFRGYFNGTPPIEFFQTYAFYVYSSILPGIYELDLTDTNEVNRMLKQTQDVLGWFEDIDNKDAWASSSQGERPASVPKWYLKDFYVQWADGVPYRLKEPYDFSFLSKYGKVFKVFDNSYSGAICFGVEKAGKRYFLKFAGAKTFDATCQNIEDIIMMLKISVPKYNDLKHPLLINQIGAEEIPCGATGGGFIAIYDWFDGEGCGYMHPVAQAKFLALPNEDKLRVYEGILDFHAHVIERGYIAIDFNNGSTLYNFDTGDFAFCDIDFYAKHSQISGWSGIWGDPSVKSPEECRGYSVITEVSNVYTMGAVAFYLFAGDDKVTREKWTLSEKQYKVAKKAISEKRSKRQQTIQQFIKEWREETHDNI